MSGAAETQLPLDAMEMQRLLEEVFQYSGYDFRHYAFASIRRRILSWFEAEGAQSASELLDRVVQDPLSMERLIEALPVYTTSMFRDPSFYIAFRQKVVPILKTYPFVRIWHAGCSSGEEVYSLAILLQEEGIHRRCLTYATDVSEKIIRVAKTGMVPLASMKEYTENYQRAGGKASFSEYYTARYESALIRPYLRDNIVFGQHSLVTDTSFNEFNVILCRNVMIYFNDSLQARVHRLLYQSLSRLGVLGLGRKESLQFTPYAASYETLDFHERLYQKVR